MKHKLRIAAWAAALAATPGCATMALDPAHTPRDRTSDGAPSGAHAALHSSVDAFAALAVETGVPAPAPMSAVLGSGLENLIHGRARGETASKDTPADQYLAQKAGLTGSGAALVEDITRLRGGLRAVNTAAAGLAQAEGGARVTKASVREMERALGVAQHCLGVLRDAAARADLSDAAGVHVARALTGFEGELEASSKLADVLEALQNNGFLLG